MSILGKALNDLTKFEAVCNELKKSEQYVNAKYIIESRIVNTETGTAHTGLTYAENAKGIVDAFHEGMIFFDPKA
jgi:hypothetical protein